MLSNKKNKKTIIFSIIIPSKDRFDILINTLRAIENINFKIDCFEVIVVNNGSKDKRYDSLENKTFKYKFSYFIEKKQGAAAARNFGVSNSFGDYVLFIGDDTVPHKNLLKEHYFVHRMNNFNKKIIVLGITKWCKQHANDDFSRIIAPYGPQFNFEIKDVYNVDYKHFYTSNISIATDSIRQHMFNDGFKSCNMEDIDLGYRLLKKNGYKMIFNDRAIVYHDHKYNLESFIERQKRLGKNKKLFLKLHPELMFNPWNQKWFLFLIFLKNSFFLKINSKKKYKKQKKIIILRRIENAWIKSFIF